MQDAIKVFVDIPTIEGYAQTSENPFNANFAFNANIRYCSVKNDVIHNDINAWSYSAEVGASPGTIYAALYSSILEYCAFHDLPTPGQDDIFAYVPTALSQIFINIPSIA